MTKTRLEPQINHVRIGRPRKRVLIPPSQRQASEAAEAPPRRRGAQPGNHNALKHGCCTRAMKAFKAEIRAVVRESRQASRWALGLADHWAAKRNRMKLPDRHASQPSPDR